MKLRLLQIESIGELRRVAEPWDRLWERHPAATPASRAEPVALRVEHLDGESSFRGLIVEEDGRFVAALPLINRRIKKLLNVGSLPCNCWLAGGALLLDPQADAAATLDCLLAAVPHLPWPMLWLDHVPFGEPTWREFRHAAERAGLSVSVREHFQIGQIEIWHNWDKYKAAMKGDNRRKVTRYLRKIDEAGGAELVLHRNIPPEQVIPLVRRAFEIEHRSWKGSEGTSVLSNPTVFDHYCREAAELARHGELEIAFLEHQSRPIAFILGYWAKGVFYSTKLGYDEEFARFGPGQLLTWRILEQFHADPNRLVFDFAGPLVPFHQVWATRSYPVGPLVVATPQILSRSLFHVYTQWQPRAKRAQEKLSTTISSVRSAAGSAGKLVRALIQEA